MRNVLPTLVIVDLPAETVAADAEILLDACTRAFSHGECRADGASEAEPYVRAEVNWLGAMHVEISVRFSSDGQQQSASRSLDFRANDEPQERYRALGFTVGSMAGNLREAVGSAPTPPREEIDAPTPAPSPPEPSEPVVLVSSPRPSAGPPVLFEDAYRVGAQLGSGINQARWGAMVGVRGTWERRWLLELSGAYTRQGSNPQGLEAQFANASLSFGVEFSEGAFVGSVAVGPVVQWQEVERAAVGVRRDNWRLGTEGLVGLCYPRGTVAPFLEARVSRFDPTELRLEGGTAQHFGPLQYQLSIGVVVAGAQR